MLPHLSGILSPLYDMSEEDFKWTPERLKAFTKAKNSLAHAATVRFPRFDRPSNTSHRSSKDTLTIYTDHKPFITALVKQDHRLSPRRQKTQKGRRAWQAQRCQLTQTRSQQAPSWRNPHYRFLHTFRPEQSSTSSQASVPRG